MPVLPYGNEIDRSSDQTSVRRASYRNRRARISVGRQSVALAGKLAPGPDYKLYLSPEFVETEADFARLKERMVRVGEVKTFENFIVRVPESVDVSRYNTVIVWCESFGQFITAAKYR